MNQRDEVTHELISAYLDGELSADERARVEQLLAVSEDHQQTLQDMRSLAAGMQELPMYQLGEPFANGVLAAARQADPSLVMPDQVAVLRSDRGVLALPVSVRQWRVGISVALTVAAALLIAFWIDDAAVDSDNGATNSGSVALLQQDNALQEDNTKEPGSQSAPLPAISTDQDPLDPATESQTLASQMPQSQVITDSNTDSNTAKSARIASDASGQRGSETQPGRPEQPIANSDVDQMASPAPQTQQTPVSKPKISVGPGWSSQKMLLVLDVQLTPAGWEEGRFERLLSEAGVAFDSNIMVDADFEKALLDSRFFEPIEASASQLDEQQVRMAIVYVVARGGAIDRVWHQLKQDPKVCSRVSMDMALQPGDTTVFRQLQQLGALASSRAQEAVRDQRSVARRLTLSPAWNGKPIDRASGALASLSADKRVDPNRVPPPPAGTAPQFAPLSLPGEMFGGNVYAEVMFVLRSGVSPSE